VECPVKDCLSHFHIRVWRIGTLEDDKTVLYKTKSLHRTKLNTNPKAYHKTNPNTNPIQLFYAFFASTVP